MRSQFSPHRHKESDKEVDIQGVAWATEQVRWFVKQGDTIFPDNPIVAQFQCHWTVKASEFPDRQPKKGRAAKLPQSVQVLRNVIFVATAKEDAPAPFYDLDECEFLHDESIWYIRANTLQRRILFDAAVRLGEGS
jgi:hypothetical protein